jgi:hypothetical protein
MTRSTTRNPARDGQRRRLWERPRFGERDGQTFFSPSPKASPISGFLAGDFDDMATVRNRLRYQVLEFRTLKRDGRRTHTRYLDTGALVLQAAAFSVDCIHYIRELHAVLQGHKRTS